MSESRCGERSDGRLEAGKNESVCVCVCVCVRLPNILALFSLHCTRTFIWRRCMCVQILFVTNHFRYGFSFCVGPENFFQKSQNENRKRETCKVKIAQCQKWLASKRTQVQARYRLNTRVYSKSNYVYI